MAAANRESLAIFAALATVEVRPLVDVLEECMADTAAHLSCTRPTLALSESELADLDRLERQEEEERAGALTTPAMRRAADASDRREMFRTEADDAADFWSRVSGRESITVANSSSFAWEPTATAPSLASRWV